MTGVRSPVEVVMSLLAFGGRRDLSKAQDLLDTDIKRLGPDGDVKSGRDEYLAYLETIMPGATDYVYEVRRCVPNEDGRTVLVEIDESPT